MERSSRETWAKRVERWRESGLTVKEFALEVGVNPSTLSYWKWRLGTEVKRRLGRKAKSGTSVVSRRSPAKKAALSVRPLSFVEVTKAGSAAVGEPFEVELVSGERVRIPSSFDADALGRLLAVLERRG